MKKIQFLLSGLIIMLTLNLSAQNPPSYEFRASSVNSKLQSEVGQNYYYVGFVIQGIKNTVHKKALLQYLSSLPQFKKININEVNEFHGFIDKDLKAKDVREILRSQNVDFKFDKYKFKGLYQAEQLKQKIQ